MSWRPHDEVYVAEVEELPGCVAEGASHAEAERNALAAIADWIAAASRAGRQVPAEGSAVRFVPDAHPPLGKAP